MQSLGAKLQSSLQVVGEIELASEGTATENAKDLNALGQARAALRAAAAKLALIVAPAAIRTDQALLLKGVHDYADELQSVINQLDKGGAPVTVLQDILTLRGVKEMQQASIAIAKKGYNIVG